MRYRASVEDEISYNRRKEYLILIDQYLSRIVSLYEFRSKFLQMKEEDSRKAVGILDDFQQLEVFLITKTSEKFSDLIEKIKTLCFEYEAVGDETTIRMSESKFYDRIKDYYLQLQEAFPFENLK